MSSANGFNVYLSLASTFAAPCLYGTFPQASAGLPITIGGLAALDGSPPYLSTAVRGAHLIDPDTELLDWHWKRPVASSAALGSGAQGDVRMALDTGVFYGVLGSGDTLLDDGSVAVTYGTQPADADTTNQAGSIELTVPATDPLPL